MDQRLDTTYGDAEHMTAFANYSVGPVTFGYQEAYIDANKNGTDDEHTKAWGLAFNVNENLSISYGERDVVFKGAVHQLTLQKKVMVLLWLTLWDQ